LGLCMGKDTASRIDVNMGRPGFSPLREEHWRKAGVQRCPGL
jgi:hypothetical protein